MLNITDHEWNANQKHKEVYHLTPVRIAITKKKKKKKGKRQQVLVRILVEKLEPFIVCGDAKWCSWYGKQNGDTFKY